MNWNKKTVVQALPIVVIVADLLYSVGENIYTAFLADVAPATHDDLPISPDFALGWLQVLINGVIVGMIVCAIWQVWQMKRRSDDAERLSPTAWRAAMTLVVLAFAFPAVWLWFWAAVALFRGQITVSFDEPRYLVVAICQPYLVWIILAIWRTQHGLLHGKKK